MKRKNRNALLYLEDMLLSMNQIETYIADMDFQTFTQSSLVTDAVIRNFEIIGEAVKNIPDSITSKYPEMPWSQMYRLRNRVSHEYFGVDLEVIWRIAKDYLPKNKILLARIIQEYQGP